MNYINDTTKEIKTYRVLNKDLNASLPADGTEVIAGIWFLINVDDKPAYNVNTDKLVLVSAIRVGDIYNQSWSIVPLTQIEINSRLDGLKDRKLAEMKTARDTIVNGVTEITTSLGNVFIVDANITNRSTMHQAITNAINAGFLDVDSINWKMGDNTYAAVTYGEMKEIGIQLGVFINTQYQKEAIKIGEINAATLDTIDDVVW